MKSIYIHIPFCNNICSYCDFAKVFYNEKYVLKYLESLEFEINNNYKNEIIDTLYIGGGTQSSLSIKELNKLFNILKKIKLSDNYEFTIECNIDSLTKDKIDLFKSNKVNRLSIGIETFNKKYLSFLNRKEFNLDILEYAKKNFNNINIDLIYAIPNETIEELNKDIDEFLKLNINHISLYSLIIEPHTKLYIDNVKNIDEDLDYEMYKLIDKRLKENGYIHYEISNYSKKGYESKHNLTYWDNKEYYGFGLGASGYIDNMRYTNTRNLDKYINHDYDRDITILDKNMEMENEMILGLRKLKGVNLKEFKEKFNIDIKEKFNIDKLIKEEKLIIKDNYIFINPRYIYLSNDILINFIGE